MGALTIQGYNLIGDGTGGSGYNTSKDLVGTAASPIDPLLGPLQDNGGPTIGAPGNTMSLQTQALLPGSPAIGAGDPTNAPATDERGFPRIVNGKIDIGAFEVQPTLMLTAPPSATAGTSFDITVTALDAFNNPVSDYTGTVDFTSSDSQAVLPADYTFTASDNGVHTFSGGVTLNTPGTQTVTATDTVTGSTASATIIVNASTPAVAHFSVDAPASVVAGSSFDIVVSAVDAQNQVVPGYTGTVHFMSSDPQATLPADYTFTSSDNGTHTFFERSHPRWRGDPDGDGDRYGQRHHRQRYNHGYTVYSAGGPFFRQRAEAVVAGSPFDITVTALDAQNQVVAGYTDTVAFTSSDPYPGVVPANYTFTSSDQGMHTFTGGVTLFTAGTQTLTVQDVSETSITGSATINVSPSSATSLLLTAPSTAVAGMGFNVIVTALDAYGNVATGYSGTVTLTSSDRNPEPAVYTFTASDGGTHSFSTSLFTARSQTLTVWDAGNSSIRGSAAVAVTAGPAYDFLITATSPSVVAGTPFSLVVTALDQFGNTATNYAGTITFTTTDTATGVVLPGEYTFTTGNGGDNGVHTLALGVTLITPGSQTLTATDKGNGINGSTSVTVAPGANPPPGGDAAIPGVGTGPVGSVWSGHQLALVDQLFASLNVQDSGYHLGKMKYSRRVELSRGLAFYRGLGKASLEPQPGNLPDSIGQQERFEPVS